MEKSKLNPGKNHSKITRIYHRHPITLQRPIDTQYKSTQFNANELKKRVKKTPTIHKI